MKKLLLMVLVCIFPVVILVSCGGGGGGGTTVDADNDGFNSSVDCDDNNPAINPGVNEICGNGIDEDCSGADLICPGGTGVINQSSIEDIIHGINPYASLGDGSDYLADLQITNHACDVGDVIITENSISDPPAANESMTVNYNNCQEFGVITNGTMTITITELTGNLDGGPPYSATIHLVYDLSSEDVNSGLVSTSSANMSISISEDAGNFSIKIQGDSLTQESEGEVETLSNFQIESTYDQNTSVFTQVLNGDLDSTLIGFPVSFNTTATFTGKDDIGSTGNPTAGVLHITNSIDNSQARLTAQADGVDLRIEVDADGDGVYEYKSLVPWTDLENL